MLHERPHDDPGEEIIVANFHAGLAPCARRHEGSSIYLGSERELSRLLYAPQHTLGNYFAAPSEWLAGGDGRHAGGSRRASGEVAAHILLSDAPPIRRGYPRQVYPPLTRETASGRRCGRKFGTGARWHCCHLAGQGDLGDHGSRLYHVATLDEHLLNHAIPWRGNLNGCLLDHQLAQHLPRANRVTATHEPVGDGAFFNVRLGPWLDNDLDGHGFCSGSLLAARPPVPFSLWERGQGVRSAPKYALASRYAPWFSSRAAAAIFAAFGSTNCSSGRL